MDFSVPSHFCVGYICQFPVVVSEHSVAQSLAQSNEIHFSTRVFNINIIECMNITMKICQISNFFKPDPYWVWLYYWRSIQTDYRSFFHLYILRTAYYCKSNLTVLYFCWNGSMITFISASELYISSYLSRNLKFLCKPEKFLDSSGAFFLSRPVPVCFSLNVSQLRWTRTDHQKFTSLTK